MKFNITVPFKGHIEFKDIAAKHGDDAGAIAERRAMMVLNTVSESVVNGEFRASIIAGDYVARAMKPKQPKCQCGCTEFEVTHEDTQLFVWSKEQHKMMPGDYMHKAVTKVSCTACHGVIDADTFFQV